MADRYTPNEAAQFLLQAAATALGFQQEGRNDEFVSWALSMAEWVQHDRQHSHLLALHVAARAVCEHCEGNYPVQHHRDEDPEFDDVWIHPPATFQDKESPGGLCAAAEIQDMIQEFEKKTLEQRSDIPNLAARMTAPNLIPDSQQKCPMCSNTTQFSDQAHPAILWSCDVCGHLQVDPTYIPTVTEPNEPEEADELDAADPDSGGGSPAGDSDDLPVADDVHEEVLGE